MSAPSSINYVEHVPAALATILAPYETWAEGGYAEGMLEFLPAYNAKPHLMSPSEVVGFFDAATDGLAQGDDKTEAEARFQFVEQLVDRMITSESLLREQHHAGRMQAMAHRLCVLLACMAVFFAAMASLPEIGAIAVTLVLGMGLALFHRHFQRKRVSVVFPDDRKAAVIATFPWLSAAR